MSLQENYIPTASVFPKTEEKLLSLTKAVELFCICVGGGAACDEIPLLNPRKLQHKVCVLNV
jgi:hypothetical protein